MALVPNPVTGQLDVAEQVTVDGMAGTGTTGTIAKFTDTEQVGDSSITDDGSTVEVDADLNVTGTISVDGTPISTGTPGGGTKSLQYNDAGGFGGADLAVYEDTVQTTDGNETVILTIPVPEDTVVSVTTFTVAREPSTGNGGHCMRMFTAHRIGSGPVVLINGSSNIGQGDNIANVTVGPDTNVTATDLEITIQGANAQTVDWSVSALVKFLGA